MLKRQNQLHQSQFHKVLYHISKLGIVSILVLFAQAESTLLPNNETTSYAESLSSTDEKNNKIFKSSRTAKQLRKNNSSCQVPLLDKSFQQAEVRAIIINHQTEQQRLFHLNEVVKSQKILPPDQTYLCKVFQKRRITVVRYRLVMGFLMVQLISCNIS